MKKALLRKLIMAHTWNVFASMPEFLVLSLTIGQTMISFGQLQ
jgi:hypothetical protein